MITLSIDVKKIDKSAMKAHSNGACYLDLVLLPNRDGQDKYGNDGMVVQGLHKDRREAGERGAILGNFRELKKTAEQPSQPAPAVDDDVPF